MALSLAVNKGGLQTVTPTSFSTADELTVTIDGVAYSVTGTGSVGTTIDAFVLAHANALSVLHNILATDGTTVLNLYNTDAARTISATNGTLGARSAIESEGMLSLSDNDTFVLSSSTVVLNRSTLSGSSYDAATFTFANATEAARGLAALEAFLQNGTRPTANGLTIAPMAVVAYD